MEDLKTNLTKLFHLGGELPAYDKDPVPALTSASQLSDPGMLQQFKALVKKIIMADAGDVALLGRRLLEDVLLPQYPEFKKQYPDRYNEYLRLIAILKFVNLHIRPMPEIQELVREYITAAIEEGMNLKDKFEDVLFSYDDIILEGRIVQALGDALTESKAILGSESQTVGSWLRDYLSFRRYPSYEEERAAASFNRAAYFNRSPNIRKLSEPQRKSLLAIIKLYDWLRFGEMESKFEDITLTGVFPGPSALLKDMDFAPVSQPASPSPVPAKQPAAPPPRVLAPAAPAPAPQPSQATPKPTPVAQPAPPRPLTKPSAPVNYNERFNLQDLLNPKNNLGVTKPGVARQTGVFGAQSSSVNIEALAKEAQAKRNEEQAQIVKKLDDLKKRKAKR